MNSTAPKLTNPDTTQRSLGGSPPERAFITLTEAAKQLNCSRRFLEKRAEDGELKLFRPSRRLVRIKFEDLNQWIESYSAKRGAQ